MTLGELFNKLWFITYHIDATAPIVIVTAEEELTITKVNFSKGIVYIDAAKPQYPEIDRRVK